MRSGLHSRLQRLEAAQRHVDAFEPYLLCLYHEDAPPGDVIAAQSTYGPSIERDPGEPLDAFTQRAGKALGQRALFAVYGDDSVGAGWLAPRYGPS